MASINTSTGYGPRNHLFYSSNPTDYQMWETRFTNYLYTLDIKLYKAALPKEDSVQDEEDFHISNRRTYAELVQVLDERSLQLIMANAANDGRKALRVLRQYYASTEKPRVLSLYEELTTLRLNDTEDITGYLIRAERAATGLRTSGEQTSDNLAIAMILKDLPETYKPLVVVHTQLDKIKTLSEFKSALNTYANTEAMRSPSNTALATHSNSKWSSTNRNPRTAPPTSDTRIQCLACGNTGHKARNCSQDRSSLFCDHCQIIGHVEAICQKRKRLFNQNKSNVNVVTTTPNTAHPSTSFHFVVNASEAHNGAPGNTPSRKLLVDTGATTHIVNSPDRFIAYDSTFAPKEHTIEVADGRRSNQLVTACGDAEFMITDATGKSQTVILHNALLAQSFPVSLFSVQADTEAGAVAIFSKGNNTIQSGDTVFSLVQHGKLYFLEDRHDGAYTTGTIQEWHRCLGHMNHEDINQLQACTQANHSYYILDSQCSRIITTRNIRIHKSEYADEKAVEEHEELWSPCSVNTGQNADTPVDITVPQVPVSPQPTAGNDEATNEDLVLHQLDVKGAYLNAPIDKELYIQQPPGYEMTANCSTRLTCRLNKSIYGLKQSGRMWYETLTDYLKANRFAANVQDPCLYTRGRVDKDDYAILVFWVDDIIVGGKTDTSINSVKTLLQEKFNMDDRGQL
ncbi:uncharacterized protein [Watersipora subatra]|uniref:uncharacterized protein n=1 Tax=Watersipora subatra TaxID=2589382 RepID=UPI00355B0808